jgi:hypothetical protein
MLRQIPTKEVGRDWERIRAGLVEVKQATTDDWLPEDVYMALKGGGASLYVGEDEQGEYLGFIVLRLVQTFHGSKVEIWCAHSATKTPLMRAYWPEIQDIARQAGANLIGFSSAREEWQVAAKRLGFVPKQITYEFTL